MIKFSLGKTGLKNLILGMICVFTGFSIILILFGQISALSSVTNQEVVLRREGIPIFFGSMLFALISVLMGGFEIGRYAEMEISKRRTEKPSS